MTSKQFHRIDTMHYSLSLSFFLLLKHTKSFLRFDFLSKRKLNITGPFFRRVKCQYLNTLIFIHPKNAVVNRSRRLSVQTEPAVIIKIPT